MPPSTDLADSHVITGRANALCTCPTTRYAYGDMYNLGLIIISLALIYMYFRHHCPEYRLGWLTVCDLTRLEPTQMQVPASLTRKCHTL